jgi:hypothetical protein
LFANILSPTISRLAVPAAIVVLPLIGFAADRVFGERVAEVTGPALYALYVLGLMAYATISYARSPGLVTVSAGVLGVGAAVSALIGIVGSLGSVILVIFVFMSPLLALLILAAIAIALSPWVTAWALGKVALSALRSSPAGASRPLILAGAAVGVCLAIAAMVLVAKADAGWLAARKQAFEADDVLKWEQSLRDIKANPFCGHRRCLMPVCNQLMKRFGLTTGECGRFACPFGFGLNAPGVPSDLDKAFQGVYGYSVKQICATGD